MVAFIDLGTSSFLTYPLATTVHLYYYKYIDQYVTSFRKMNPIIDTMMKHYILNLNPTAKYEWDRYILREPLTAKRPDMARLIAEAVGADTGSYLVSVNIEITVLDRAAVPQAEQMTLPFAELNISSQYREAA
jgi:hypothetical protein